MYNHQRNEYMNTCDPAHNVIQCPTRNTKEPYHMYADAPSHLHNPALVRWIWLTWPFVAAPKNKKQKKKKSGAKSRPNGDETKPNGIKAMDGADHDNDINDEPEPELERDTPAVTTYNGDEDHKSGTEPNEPLNNGIDTGITQLALPGAAGGHTSEESTKTSPASNTAPTSNLQRNGATSKSDINEASAMDTDAKLEALAKEREALRDEVAELRKSLERLQGKHDEEITDMRGQLEETQGEKEHAETQYRTLLGKVNTIKSQLGERLKADAVCIHPLLQYTLLLIKR